MTENPRVEELLEELLESDATPEEVCRACPELLPEVRAGWQRLRVLKGEVGALFPESTSLNDDTPEGAPRADVTSELPQVRGYEVRHVLGRGGMGVVYEAWHLQLKRPVALKMLLLGGYAQPDELERFLREAEAIAGVRHGNIVQVYDVGNFEGRPYFTMEFVEGGSLAQKLAGTPLSAAHAAALVATVAEAVHVAHHSGIIHRDLKPANILLTSGGIPKITDFGLARRLEDGAALTITGVPLGTPSYMAPEQAQGQRDALGPGTDVYALGAILYEMLTGRPPFRAETAAATIQQVVTDEPVPPARVNPGVPRDLDTICLKCLHKEPQKRYASAQLLADDLHRFGRGEPISARPVAPLARVLRWVRRRPARATALAAAVLLVLSLGGTTVWWYQQQAAAERAVATDVDLGIQEAVRLRQQLDFANADKALQRARRRLGDQGPAALQNRLTQESQNLELVSRLDALRLEWMYSGTRLETSFLAPDPEEPDPEALKPGLDPEVETRVRFTGKYMQVFRDAGLGEYGDDPTAVAARVAASPVSDALLAGLDNWVIVDMNMTRRQWVLRVARLADPDPWRDRVRNLDNLEDDGVIKKLAEQADFDRQPVHLLLLVADGLWVAHEDERPFLTRVMLARPADFWANLAMGNAQYEQEPLEAIGCYRTALAVRPTIGRLQARLGHLYQGLHRPVEAIHHLEHALRLDPADGHAHLDLGSALQEANRPQEAVVHFRECARLNPTWAVVHLYLGDALKAEGRLGEAMEEYRAGFRGDNPGWTEVRDRLRDVLWEQGRAAEFRLMWKEVLPTKSGRYDVWDGYAELCLFLGEEADYRSARQDLLKEFEDPVLASIAGNTGLACLMLPASKREYKLATKLIDAALAADRKEYAKHKDAYPFFLLARGLAAYRQGRFKQAASAMEAKELKVLGPTPLLVGAMAQYRLGQKEGAGKALAAAVVSYDWQVARAKDRAAWIAHILRREAEALILPNLPAFLKGE